MNEIKSVGWRSGFRAKVAADKAFSEVDKIRKKNDGRVTAGSVVDQARPRRNPLHKQFEWDDSKAAEEFRKEEARTMLRSIEVVYEEAQAVGPVRALEVVTEVIGDEPQKFYRSTSEILEDPNARDELLGNAIRDALSFKRRYALLSELAGIFHELDEFVSNAKV